jgi:hypothetical protein
MRTKSSFPAAARAAVLQCLVLTGLLCFGAGNSRADHLFTCPGEDQRDFIDRGFYVPSYPGNSLDYARLRFSSATVGSYTVTLTVRSNTYNGAIIGTATETFDVSGTFPQDDYVWFSFPGPRIRKGSRVCFEMTLRSGPRGGSLYYRVGGCSEVIETDGTTPPLDTWRRNGVDLILWGEDTLIVDPGESIQAAINAASLGSTIYVNPGVYTEDLTLRSRVNVSGAGYRTTTLRGTGSGTVVTANQVSNAFFEGFTVTRSGKDSSDAGFRIIGGNLLVNNNAVVGNANGIQIWSESSAIIRNNLIQGNGNLADSVLNYGLICLHASPLIANNLVVSNLETAIYIGWTDSAGAQLINNTIVSNRSDGIWFYQASATAKNNIVVGNGYGLAASHGAVPDLTFNNVWGNGDNYNSQSGGSSVPGLGSLSSDPLFDITSIVPFSLAVASPCINAGDPAPIYNDRDGSRNDLGAYGGPTGLDTWLFSPLTSGFLFTSVGKIPASEITQAGVLAGLANVSTPVANALHLYQHKDAPFGGWVWLQGLFGMNDTGVQYYRIYAAKWNGATRPGLADFLPVTDALSKIKYTVSASGKVTSTLESVGPDSSGMYLRTDRADSGYWAHPDLKLILNTGRLEPGRWDFLCKAYNAARAEVSLPGNDLSRITLWVDNRPVTATIDSVRDRTGHIVTECGVLSLLTNREDLQFEISVNHAGGFLMNYTLQSWHGRNRYDGVIATDQYVGSHDGSRPEWSGVPNLIVHSAPAHAAGTLAPWATCAYQFYLEAWARTTDGFTHLYYAPFRDHYFLQLGPMIPTGCVADLDHDGDVDGADLVIFASQFGRTNCVTTP